MFWSWQHNDDLTTLDDKTTGVCYFVGRCLVHGDTISFERSQSRVLMPETIFREAAVRVEVSNLDTDLASEHFATTVDALADKIVAQSLAPSHKIDSVQIDFDARLSERPFYRSLIQSVRNKLPAGVQLSITSLASWCLGDNWLASVNLPVNAIVPMFFSMGPASRQVGRLLENEKTLRPSLLAGRVAPGLSLDEPELFDCFRYRRQNRLENYRSVYLFSSHAWNDRRLESAIRLISTLSSKVALAKSRSKLSMTAQVNQ